MDSDCSSESEDDDAELKKKALEKIRRDEWIAQQALKNSASLSFDDFSHHAPNVIVQSARSTLHECIDNISSHLNQRAQREPRSSRKEARKQCCAGYIATGREVAHKVS